MLTLGADVEFLVKKPNGSLASVEGLIGGSKKYPRWYDVGNLQEDNVLAEMAINPCADRNEWITNLGSLRRILNEVLMQKGFVADISASAIYPEELLVTPQAKEFGCEPDYNAWLVSINDPPNSDTNIRSAGGHVHVGLPKDSTGDMVLLFEFTKWLDLYLGIPSVLIDDDVNRRTLYGQAGSFRPKGYGLEYRTLSNFWVKNAELMDWVWDQVHRAWMDFSENDFEPPEVSEDTLVGCINNSVREEADNICREFNIEVPMYG